MSTIVILSSSPPRAFARSPTPSELPPPLPSPGSILSDVTEGLKRFKSVNKTRDGFSDGFSGVRSLLTTKAGVENIPLHSPGQDSFQSTGSASVPESSADVATGAKFLTTTLSSQNEQHSEHVKNPESGGQMCYESPEASRQAKNFDFPNDGTHIPQSNSQAESSSLQLEKALPRRLDWTPAKPHANASANISDLEEPSVGFSKDLLNYFTFAKTLAGESADKITTKIDTRGEPTKRRRIDFAMTAESHNKASLLSDISSNREESKKDGGKKRNKSPSKKALTITGLATSNYGDEQQKGRKTAPMLERLTATQLGAGCELESSMEKARKKPAKPRASSKKAPTKSRLVSPTSALKAFDDQEMLFGSASQLARDESPTLMRDTPEVLKRSECFLSSDPISSQQTPPFSIESMSAKNSWGTNRFVKRRNLWGAAGRDEDNALLQVDTIDLIDSPAVRLALTGKDALVQPAVPGHQKNGTVRKERTILYHDETPLTKKGESMVDIDDIVTPAFQATINSPTRLHVRSYHTARPLEAPQIRPGKGAQDVDENSREKSAPQKSATSPVRPSYAGFSTHDLQKQLSAYGFKPIKKREKMIEILDRCWDDKHGVTPDEEEEEPADTTKHGDFLSKVHDISARQVPKAKKARAKRKSEASDPTPMEPEERERTETMSKDPVSEAEKTPRKRATKKKLSDETIMDVNDIDSLSLNVEDEGGPAEKIIMKRKKKTSNARAPSRPKKPATPPPTLPSISFSPSPAFEPLPAGPSVQDPSTSILPPTSRNREITTPGALTPAQTPALPDIQTQIRAAIYFTPSNPDRVRNHTLSPTWREKILMYDPIVLEDLTVWLNTEGFRLIGEDREVNPLEVRAWCEQNGICCLWKGGWRGRGR
ncbi:uncharacterized protein Z518_02688 [Rhinocladiella mackenziei CBS 650.93]|uniref:Structure-specific endonuclease subunit SLX4 n=1 Tax=Rhinocladiella mackenziei CBS 650.93 TaxID=1442369 RepID=A0A0D2HC81_9EURO|nr:uncharacterized protein Z518_02688 [Rhinocladiella mackenziei CBS 650.93]KIX08033.1 hypothetical protein Z518_02688 [Rhinocladiella mackenziei CBS 650.93]